MEKVFRLPKEFTLKWLKALRSGEYKQTDDVLFRPQNKREGISKDCYCCLGVGAIICGISKDEISYLELPSYKMSEKNYPGELIEDSNKYNSDLQKILTLLNDCYYSGILKHRDYLNIPSEIIEKLVFHKQEGTYNFNDIAQFIEDNVELY